jgi:hypothetical protein
MLTVVPSTVKFLLKSYDKKLWGIVRKQLVGAYYH